MNKLYAAIVQTQNGSYLFYKLLPFEEKRKEEETLFYGLSILFYYKLTKVMCNNILYKLVW